ncbi:MAG: AMP-binding domain-containing protein [Burkholderia sp.]|jgi:o-succinylbenzoate---CoA ligase
MICPQDDDALLSIGAAAAEAPERAAVRTPQGDVTYRELAGFVKERIAQIERPAPGRPALFVAEADLGGIAGILAHLEARIPVMLLSPKLTAYERAEAKKAADAISEPLPEGTAAVIMTSGTTGRPKAAVISRASLAASARAVASALRMTPDDVFQLAITPSRVGGLGVVIRSLAVRGCVSLAPKFSAERFPDILARDGVTLASVVPAMLAEVLAKRPEWRAPGRLRALLVGGAACPMRIRGLAAERRIPIVTTYAMTETASSVALSDYDERFVPRADAGRAVPGAEIRIGAESEIEVKGPMVTAGYWGRAAPIENGWLRTGDIGALDAEGRLRVFSRRSEMILTGGDNVFPGEVEAALEAVPGIRAALVTGLPDETWGAIVTALLVPEKEGAEIGDAALARAVSERLARFKAPRRIAWVKALPRTAAGKLCRSPKVLQGLSLRTLHYSRPGSRS